MALHHTFLSNCTFVLTSYTLTLTLGQLLLHGTVKQYEHTSNTIHVFVTLTKMDFMTTKIWRAPVVIRNYLNCTVIRHKILLQFGSP